MDSRDRDSPTEEEIGYVFSDELIAELNKNPKIAGRSDLVHSLIESYALLDDLRTLDPVYASEKDLTLFHSQDYIDRLKTLDENSFEDETNEEYGLGYDCPLIDDMYDYAAKIAGSSLTAAHYLMQNKFKYVINWFGGWHHAKREKASGFCYVNDIVISILKLRQKYNRILYLDLDLHHGDGVQEAFEFTNKVMTLSFHKWSPGFFPGTGGLDEIGKGTGKYYTINVPLQSGIDDSMFYQVFSKVFEKVIEAFRPEVIVVQCGADALYGDPIEPSDPFNLTSESICKCIQDILDTKISAMFLGGGGYNFANTARLWCSITALLLRKELGNDIPEHENFLRFSPDYELSIVKGKCKNKNSQASVDTVLNTIMRNLSNIQAKTCQT